MIKETDSPNEWDMVISHSSSWFDLRLKELWHYKDLLLILVRRDFIAAYKQTILGPLWHFLQPLCTTIIFVIVFKQIARIDTGDVPAPLFYLCGLTIWNYFSSCLFGTSSTFIANAYIFGKVYFPRLIIPISVIISNGIKLGIQCLLLLTVMLYYAYTGGYHFTFGWNLLLVPFSIVISAFLGLSLGILISALTTKYRDVTVLMSFGVQLLMYATPIIYPLSYVPLKYKALIGFNPLTWLIETFRNGLLGKDVLDIRMLGYTVTITAVLFFASILVFSRVEKTFIDTV